MRLRPSKEKEEANLVLGQLEGLKTSLRETEAQVPKRQAQKLRKEYQALEMYYVKEMKRGQIAKALRLSPQQVTEIVEKFKRDMAKIAMGCRPREALHLPEESKGETNNQELFT